MNDNKYRDNNMVVADTYIIMNGFEYPPYYSTNTFLFYIMSEKVDASVS